MHRRLAVVGTVLLALLAVAHIAAGGPAIPDHVQVLVVGGTPAGIAAAVAAARAGMTTLLVEPREEIGGDITLSWLNMLDLNRGPTGEPLTRGIFDEVQRALGQAFDIDQARAVFAELVNSQPTLTVVTRTGVEAPVLHDGALTGVTLVSANGRRRVDVTAEEFIDATDDASLAAASGVPYTVGREESGIDRRMQAATLVFHLGNVDYRATVRAIVAAKKAHNQLAGVRGRYVWGFGSIVRHYQPHNPRLGAYDLNLGWQRDGTVLVNALQIHDVDGTNPQSLAEARTEAVAELPYLVAFLRSRIPGFEDAELIDAAPYLYVRETRHMTGLYRMTAQDILTSQNFWDRIAVASYPIDLHPYVPHQMNPFRVTRRVYAIPFRILVPRRVDHLMIVGKPVSASYTAAGSLRMIPTGMAMGEAAGEAAAIAIRTGTTPARIAADPALVAQLQRRLVTVGAYLARPQQVFTRTLRRPPLTASPKP